MWSDISVWLTESYEAFRVPLNIAIIVIAAVLVNWILRMILKRTVNQIVHGVKKAQDVDTTSEIQAGPLVSARAVQRTRTLGSVGRAMITWTVAGVALVLILGQLGVNLAAVLTSAGIVAAGLAFGAQNIVKDVLNGIFMVFEDQVGVGDWVTIDQVSGNVEDVGIRVTQVRSIDGTLWFVRNGEILSLGNASQGWGRAIIDITVEARTDIDHVEQVTLDAAKSLMKQPKISRKITGEPEVWGVEAAHGDRATLRLVVQTRAESQWEVQRALRSELIKTYDREGIELATELPNFAGKQP